MSGWACDWCGAAEGRGCSPECACPGCEASRALDDDADAYAESARP